MIGEIVSHYKITGELGKGGMGVIYRAEDLRLDRPVALKFLPPDMVRDEEARARFTREAKAASALDHPNICTIYEIDETEDGQVFIAMACYEGETLREKIESGPLGFDQIVDIVGQIARGLSKAHQAGIVHRDIKPANLMVTTDGLVKILDFGLAKLSHQTQITKAGATFGTVAYMSPEQAGGDEVDHRTDIWSLGVLIYEMLTGKLPFKGESNIAVVRAILDDHPAEVAKTRKGIPGFLRQIVKTTLRKDPGRRYQDIGELAGDLSSGKATSRPEVGGEQSVAVLPFGDLSPEADQAYFTDGLTEEVISNLNGIAGLRVIARTSIMVFKGTEKPIRQIGGELGVRFVVEGSVRKSGDALRINARLVDSVTEEGIWEDKFSGEAGDVFDMQERVARSIVKALRVKLGPEDEKRLRARPLQDTQAYEYYLKARHEIWKWDDQALDRALKYLEAGLERVGENALLHVAIGRVYWQRYNIRGTVDEDWFNLAREHVTRARELDPDLSEGESLLGAIVWFQHLRAALPHLERANEGHPNDPDTIRFLSFLYMFLGDMEKSASFVRAVLEVDPLCPMSYLAAGWQHLYKGELDQALEEIRKVTEMAPMMPNAKFSYALVLAYCGRVQDACEHLEELWKQSPSVYHGQVGRVLRHSLRGERDQALSAVTTDLEKKARVDFEVSWELAGCYALIGEADKAVEWLAHSVSLGFINYPFLSSHDPFLKKIGDSPRFVGLMRKVKREWEQFTGKIPDDTQDDKSIVVLPFENVSPEKDNEYFADGLTEEIIHMLSRARALKVIARTSSMAFKNSEKPVGTIARELGVGYVVEGSVRKAGDSLRITAKLVDASDGIALWSERFDRDMGNLFSVQDEIALAVVDKLEVNLLGKEKSALTRHATDDPEVHNLYLLGWHHIWKITVKDLEIGKEYFEQALAIDPTYAPAHVGIALFYLLMSGGGLYLMQAKDAIPRARAAAERALEFDPNNCDAHCQLTYIHCYFMLDMEAAERHIKLALESNPNSSEAHRNYSLFLTNDGRPEEAIEEIQRAIELDPVSLINYQNASWSYYVARRWDDTLDYCERALQLKEDFLHGKWGKALVYMETGKVKEAVRILENLAQVNDLFKPHLGRAYVKSGRIEDAERILVDLERKMRAGEPTAILIAMAHAALGNADEAIRYIRIATSERPVSVLLASSIKCEPAWWDEIRDHPRFRTIVAGEPDPSLAEKSIVVLPFDDLSPGKDNAYFADGLTEEIISDLSAVHSLRVISRTSSMMLKGTEKSLGDIARELNVQYVLEGSVRKAGDNLRITAQLIETASDSHLWVEKYTGTLDDIFGIQEEVSRKIVEGLKVELTPEESRKLAEHPIPDARAFDFYQLARHHLLSMSLKDIDKAERYLEQGMECTGENALLLAGLGYVKFQRMNLGFRLSEDSREIEELVERAFRLEPDLVQGHVLLGLVNQAILGNQKKSIAHFKRALEISPNDPDATLWLEIAYMIIGRFGEGIRLVEKLEIIDPLQPLTWGQRTCQHFFRGDFQLAAKIASEARSKHFIDPSFGLYFGLVNHYAGQIEQAQVDLSVAMKGDSSEAWAHLSGLLKFGLAGAEEEVEKLEASDVHGKYWEYWRRDPHISWFVAVYNAALGRKNRAMDFLEASLNCGFINYPFLAEHDPIIGTLHGEERFEKFLEEVKVLWETFDA